MGYTVAQKLIKSHLVSGEMKVGSEVGLKIDQNSYSGCNRHYGIS